MDGPRQAFDGLLHRKCNQLLFLDFSINLNDFRGERRNTTLFFYILTMDPLSLGLQRAALIRCVPTLQTSNRGVSSFPSLFLPIS